MFPTPRGVGNISTFGTGLPRLRRRILLEVVDALPGAPSEAVAVVLDKLLPPVVEGGAEATIRIRGNARPDSPGKRGEEVRLRLALGYGDWASLMGYGMRWMVEAFFSAVKRKFGERLRARSAVGLPAEAMQRFPAYDMMRSYAMARTGAVM
ncbi:MAG: hypothetical protein ACP5UD_08375 [Conexivisphaera sp.]|jgi:hypothetical protein